MELLEEIKQLKITLEKQFEKNNHLITTISNDYQLCITNLEQENKLIKNQLNEQSVLLRINTEAITEYRKELNELTSLF